MMDESSRKNYTIDEDKFLCHIYFDISQDPIIGINQSRGQLWSRVAEKYNKERRSDLHPRPQRSIEKRIGSILTSVAHLRGCVRQIENLNSSGASEQDIMNRAKILYAQESKDNKAFPFDHVWNIVKDCEKIAGDKIHPTKKSKTRATYLDTSQSDTPLEESPQSGSPMFSTFPINLSDDNIGDSSERPIGVKKSKSKKKRDKDISQIQRTMEEQHRELLNVLKQGTAERQQNYDLQKIRLEQEERKMDERILYKDLSKITDPTLREYTKAQQQKILQKRLEDERRENDNFGSYFGDIGGSGSGLPHY
ncbi:glutathione S-transferase T3-like [Primulina tabacum]|uniref:glutathione S-transferase T3-like n=1 Tax=Primulina tabacum TaxID=48773 RepID=UPI003F59BA5A